MTTPQKQIRDSITQLLSIYCAAKALIRRRNSGKDASNEWNTLYIAIECLEKDYELNK